MAVLTATNVKEWEIGSGLTIQKLSGTVAAGNASDEWIATDLKSILAVLGSVVTGTAPVGTDTITAPVAASLVFTYTGVNDLTVTIDGVVYTSNADPAATDHTEQYLFDIGTTATEAATKLADAINGGCGQGDEAVAVPGITTFGIGTPPHPSVKATAAAGAVTVTARVPGTAGNSIAVAENETNGSWASAGTVLAGGVDAAPDAAGLNFVLNSQGTANAADTSPGDLGVESSGTATTFDVVVLGIRR